MSRLIPIAFDIETTGFEPAASVTIAGIYAEAGVWMGLNTGNRTASETRLLAYLMDDLTVPCQLSVTDSERDLLEALSYTVEKRLDPDTHYLAAFNGETWRGGFDLPFLRTAYVKHDLDWPFSGIAYADVQKMMERFNTGESTDLASCYELLIGNDHPDPFEDSQQAVKAFESADWCSLLLHNLADLKRTYELTLIAERFVAKSDFRMKNLQPPG